MIVLYIVILIYFNFNITSIVNVFMLSIEKTNKQKNNNREFVYIILHSRQNQSVHLFKACAYLIESIFPLPVLLNKDKDGKGKSSNNIL